jgi:hypothetical protein
MPKMEPDAPVMATMRRLLSGISSIFDDLDDD